MSVSTCTLSTTQAQSAAGASAQPGRLRRRVTSVGIIGGSGYTGLVLAELLQGHSHLELAAITSENLAGQQVSRHAPRLRTRLSFSSAAEVNGIDAAFVCLPHGQAAPVVAGLLEEGVRVVDLSADFRLDAQTYAAWYGEHPFPQLLPAVYGLTELNRDQIAGSDLVANPGCYPTAALLALTPLLHLGLCDVVIDAKSGVSGAGKTPKESTHFCSIDSDLYPYAVTGHRHYPEIAARLTAAFVAGNGSHVGVGGDRAAPSLTFLPHLAPLQRGIEETIYVKAAKLPTAGELRALYRDVYAGETFVHVVDEPPQLKDVAYTNDCRIFASVDERAGRIILVSVIDNLMKGAAGQALQNMNVMLGLPEDEGLL
jgi:N-acetyl-gamma-glutamyl-phosphate reductase